MIQTEGEHGMSLAWRPKRESVTVDTVKKNGSTFLSPHLNTTAPSNWLREGRHHKWQLWKLLGRHPAYG